MSSSSSGPSMKAALLSGVISLNPRRPPSTSGPESSRRPLTMSSIRRCTRFCSHCFGSSPPSASSELQSPVSWAMVIHPFVRNSFDTLTPHFISDDVVLRRIFGNQLEYETEYPSQYYIVGNEVG